MLNQPIPVRATTDVGTPPGAASDGRPQLDRWQRPPALDREPVAAPVPRTTAQRKRPSRVVDLLAVALAALYVASISGLATFTSPDPDLALSAPALISGALSILTAVACFIVAYAKAVPAGTHD